MHADHPDTDRQDTDAILSYYQSADAAFAWQDPSSPSPTESTTRTTSRPSEPRAASPPSTTGALRRTSIPSQGGTDRRRLAIVEMDARRPAVQDQLGFRCSDSGGGPPDTCLEANYEGLALVAPPDASPQCYSALTPPSTLPVSKPQPSITINHPISTISPRSPSDATAAFPKVVRHVPRKSSREVAIVGTTSLPGPASVSQQANTPLASDSLRPPLFQIPQSRSPSPGNSDLSDSGCSTSRGRQRKDALAPGVSPIREVREVSIPVRTPSIGESKHISDRVAGPVVISLSPRLPLPSPVFSSPPSSTQDLMSPRTNLSSPLTPSTALTSPSATPSPYLYYQPGLHATAGPLPPPPQAVFPIDPKSPPPPRPPRNSRIRSKDEPKATKQAFQLPSHVTATLRTRCSSPSTEVSTSLQKVTVPPVVSPPTDSPESSHEDLGSDLKPHHVREGAFPPSRLCTLDSVAPHEEIATSLPRLDSMDDLVASIGLAIDDMGVINSCDVPPPTVVEPPRGNEGQNGRKGLEIRRPDNLKLSLSPERPHAPLPSSPRSDESAAQGWVDPDRTVTRSEEIVPPVPAKNDLPYLDTKSLKNALNIKRFSSLPRTPSLMSLNRRSIGSKRSSGTPSPSIAPPASQPKLPMRKTKSSYPSAMFFADVTVKRTALERSTGYAYKINELYNCDCGLGDWIAVTRYKALHPHSSAKRLNVNSSRSPRAPSTTAPSITPRHISQSSTDSGVTFPIRADAYSATDLASRAAGDASPPNAPPPLPYPALAAAPRSGPSRASTIIATSSTSSSRSAASPSAAKSPGGFFASLGRRASMKRETRLTPPSLVKTLSRSPPRNGNEQPSPRPANLPLITQSVPGGPRAPPSRMQRSQTIILTPQNSTNGETPQRSSMVARRPSLFDGRGSAHRNNSSVSEAEFARQVDKLTTLLPKADRNVLAIYLRRAGQDILAIGQYLEDEKNGKLRYE
ncbi:hypothetical protein L210DRAFT_963438 [Boletus edulis BED1]|uniref:Uncharacterized protein n=1 Tax=Boletus edulis BED1 TaxID=1328754 RepID=A0AAD4C6W9_BOLED|nr:hypothetical protein L210DRAFT_963438 [Boletus edulis BED1]